jgi:seryl-tRNA synthetase
MYDIKWVRENPAAFLEGLRRRHESNAERILSEILQRDEERRKTIAQVQEWQETRNRKSREIGAAKKAGDETKAAELMEEVSRLKGDITKAGEQVADKLTRELERKLAEIPNIPLPDVPDGTDSNDNVEHHHFGAKRDYRFIAKEHFDLGEALDQMDFETAAKLSGSRFVVLKRDLARMGRALGQFMLDLHTREHGYTEVAPPLLVRDDVMYGTAQLPKFREDQFALKTSRPAVFEDFMEEMFSVVSRYMAEHPDTQGQEGFDKVREYLREKFGDWIDNVIFPKSRDISQFPKKMIDLWLIPTAEVPLTNLVREQILDEDVLPLRFTALTPCFRAEAGAAGKDTRGMLRQHQFDKVELVSITTPEESRDEHERMLSCAEEVLRRLDLHYRVVTLCTGDMGFASQKTYDIEVWLPGQGAYREISSCSVCGDFQARRMDARYRGKSDRSVRHVHTLNGSGVAVGRALIAVMETYQDQGGGIAVPDVLQPYMGGVTRIERAAK